MGKTLIQTVHLIRGNEANYISTQPRHGDPPLVGTSLLPSSLIPARLRFLGSHREIPLSPRLLENVARYESLHVFEQI